VLKEMMKKITALFAASLILTACGSSSSVPESETTEKADETVTETATPEPTQEAKNENIVKSGEVNYFVDGEIAKRGVISWDLGYSQHSLTKGDEVLCIKFEVTNKGEQNAEIWQLLNVIVYVDGVEESGYISDFYGDGTAYKTVFEDKIRSGATGNMYLCFDVDVDTLHTIDIDFRQEGQWDDEWQRYVNQYNDPVVDTVQFVTE